MPSRRGRGRSAMCGCVGFEGCAQLGDVPEVRGHDLAGGAGSVGLVVPPSSTHWLSSEPRLPRSVTPSPIICLASSCHLGWTTIRDGQSPRRTSPSASMTPSRPMVRPTAGSGSSRRPAVMPERSTQSPAMPRSERSAGGHAVAFHQRVTTAARRLRGPIPQAFPTTGEEK